MITIILYISAIVIGLIFRKSKICTAYIATIMYLIAAFNYQRVDMDNYIMHYRQTRTLVSVGTSRYPGFAFLNYLGNKAGLDFYQYQFFFYGAFVILLLVGIGLFTKQINPILSYYLIYSYAMDIVQMRSGIGQVLVLVGLGILYRIFKKEKDGSSINRLYYLLPIVFCSLATLMHAANFYFIAIALFLLIFKNRKEISRPVLIIFIIAVVIIYLGGIQFFINAGSRMEILGETEYLSRYAVRNSRFGFLRYVVLVLLIVIGSCFDKTGTLISEENKYKIHALSNIVLTSLFTIPLLAMNRIFDRLLKIYMILMYIINVNKNKNRVLRIQSLIGFLAFGFALIFCIYWYDYIYYDGVFGSLMKYNSLFS